MRVIGVVPKSYEAKILELRLTQEQINIIKKLFLKYSHLTFFKIETERAVMYKLINTIRKYTTNNSIHSFLYENIQL